jgi:hypothetical protein
MILVFHPQATGRTAERWINGHSLIHFGALHFFIDLRKIPKKCSDVHMAWPVGHVNVE